MGNPHVTRRLAPFATALVLCCAPAFAQQYPSKPVKMVIAFPPGGGNDFIGRFIAQRLSASLGQQFVVENRPGACGTIGVENGLKVPPDGYTLMLITNS